MGGEFEMELEIAKSFTGEEREVYLELQLMVNFELVSELVRTAATSRTTYDYAGESTFLAQWIRPDVILQQVTYCRKY